MSVLILSLLPPKKDNNKLLKLKTKEKHYCDLKGKVKYDIDSNNIIYIRKYFGL